MNRSLEREVFELDRELNEWINLIPTPRVTESRDRMRKLKKRREKLWDEWVWQGSTQGWDLSGVEEEEPDEEVEQNQDGVQSKTGGEAASDGAQPDPDPFDPVNTQPPLGGVQPSLPSFIPQSQLWCTSECCKHPTWDFQCTAKWFRHEPRDLQCQTPDQS